MSVQPAVTLGLGNLEKENQYENRIERNVPRMQRNLHWDSCLIIFLGGEEEGWWLVVSTPENRFHDVWGKNWLVNVAVHACVFHPVSAF